MLLERLSKVPGNREIFKRQSIGAYPVLLYTAFCSTFRVLTSNPIPRAVLIVTRTCKRPKVVVVCLEGSRQAHEVSSKCRRL
jgi:hypothetical protein